MKMTCLQPAGNRPYWTKSNNPRRREDVLLMYCVSIPIS